MLTVSYSMGRGRDEVKLKLRINTGIIVGGHTNQVKFIWKFASYKRHHEFSLDGGGQ